MNASLARRESNVLAVNESMIALGRVPSLVRSTTRVGVAEWGALVFFGAAAALCSALLDYKLKLPGHAIIRAVFPMACGLALVPRRGAGVVMAGSAVCTVFGLGALGLGGLGSGAFTSLTLTGLLLDVAVRIAHRPWQVYAGVIAAGLAANLCAFSVHAAAKAGWLGLAEAGGGLARWWPRAVVSYPLCGLIAGLVTAVVVFRLRPRSGDPESLTPQDNGP